MKKYYAGIGSRQTPPEVQEEMKKIASKLEDMGYILRSGGAKGADKAFESGVKCFPNKLIYTAYANCDSWCFEEVSKHMQPNRPPLEEMSGHVQNLLGRNMMIILGKNKSSPAEFVVCWTPVPKPEGGTGYGMRCAEAHGIPVYNLLVPEEKERLYVERLWDVKRVATKELFLKKASKMTKPVLVRNQNESGAINEWYVFDEKGHIKDSFDVCFLSQSEGETDEEYDEKADMMHELFTSWIEGKVLR